MEREKKMNWNAIIMFSTVLAIAISVGDFLRNPEKYGDIMRRFDEARYYQLDCDCTVSME